MKYKYWILTFTRDGITTTEFYWGNLVMFILVEKELGRNVIINFAHEITEEEYNRAILVKY